MDLLQQLFMQHLMGNQQPRTQGILPDWLHWGSPAGRDDINTTYYNPVAAPYPKGYADQHELLRQQHRLEMLKAVRQFGGDTPASRQQYRSDFWQKRPGYGWARNPNVGSDFGHSRN